MKITLQYRFNAVVLVASLGILPCCATHTIPPAGGGPLAEVQPVSALGAWTPHENGCKVQQAGTQFHVTGTNDQDDFNHWIGVTSSTQFPVHDFDVSADFTVPQFKGSGNALLYLRVKTSSDDQLGLLYQPRAGLYSIQGWVSGGSSFSQPSLRQIGTEATAFHRMRLHYDANTKMATAWVDDRSIGKLRYELRGKMQFEMVANTDKAGNQIDFTFDHFALTVDGKVIVPHP